MSSPFSDADQEIQIIKAYVAAVTCKTLHSDFVNMAEVSMTDQIEVQAPTRSLVFAAIWYLVAVATLIGRSRPHA